MPIQSTRGNFAWPIAALTLSMASLSCGGTPASVVATSTPTLLPSNLITAMQKPNGSKVDVRYRVDGGAAARQAATVTMIFDAKALAALDQGGYDQGGLDAKGPLAEGAGDGQLANMTRNRT